MIPMLNSVLLSALIALAAQAPSQTSPRALLERGALAEEHQRDFTGAQKLYEQAEAAAKAAGDTKTAAEASAAKERVLARQGKGPASQAQDAAVQAQLRGRAVSMLFKAQTDMPTPANIDRAVQQLADLGPSIVDLLALSLTDSASTDVNEKPPHVPVVAAKALARLRLAEADRALIAAYDSPDPTIRKCVIEAAEDVRFTELTVRAASDPVWSIADMAVSRLKFHSDLRATPVIVAEVRAGDFEASSWLFRYAPQELLGLMFDPGLSPKRRETAFKAVNGAAQLSFVSGLLERARKAPSADASLRALVADALARAQLQIDQATPVERDEFARELASVEDPDFDSWAVAQLAAFKPSAAMSPLLAALTRRRGAAKDADLERLLTAGGLMRKATPGRVDFAAWTKVALACDAGWQEVSYYGQSRTIQEHIWFRIATSEPTVPLALWGQTWSSIPESHRRAYVSAFLVRLRLNKERGPKERAGADVHALLAHLLAADDATLARFGMEQLELEADPNLIADACRTHERRLANASSYLAAAFRAAPQETLTRLEAELRPRVEVERDASTSDSAIELLTALDVSVARATWERLWLAAKSQSARAALLDVMLYPSWTNLETAARVVELYPAIERDAPARRTNAIRCFADWLVEAALPILERELRNPDSTVRAAAMEAAEAFRKHREAVAEFDAWRKAVTVEQSTVTELSKLLESPNRDVVLGAVKALAILRARPALPTLVKLLERDDKELRAAVQSALDVIGGS